MLDAPLTTGPAGPRPPGDPAGIRDLARLLRLHAGSARRLADAGGTALSVTPWEGRAATAARAGLRSWQRGVDGEAARLLRLAGRLEREADAVESAQAAWQRRLDAHASAGENARRGASAGGADRAGAPRRAGGR